MIDEIVAKRSWIYQKYFEILNEIKHIDFVRATDPNGFFPWAVCLRFTEADENFVPRLRRFLSDRGVDTRPGFTSARLLPYFAEVADVSGDLPISDKLSYQTILLPQYFTMSATDIERICKTITEFVFMNRTRSTSSNLARSTSTGNLKL